MTVGVFLSRIVCYMCECVSEYITMMCVCVCVCVSVCICVCVCVCVLAASRYKHTDIALLTLLTCDLGTRTLLIGIGVLGVFHDQ